MRRFFNCLFFNDYELSFSITVLGKIIAFLTALSVCVLVSGFLYMIPGKHYLYYFSCALSLLYIFYKGGSGIRLNKQMFFLYVIIFLNVLVLPILPLFRSQERAAYFFFITMVCSPVIESQAAFAYRERLFKYILIGFSILTVLSFFCFFLGINMMPFNREGSMELYEDYMNVGGKFSGLFNHSMILGPIAALTALVHFNLYLKYNKAYRLILFFICSMSCLFSASRAALFGLALGISLLFYKLLVNRHSYLNINKVIYIFIIFILILIPIADVAFSGLKNKMEITKEQFGSFNSREAKFKSRLHEFSESPLWGVGFASIDINTGDVYNKISGQIEPGSSHLAVLAQTGLIGITAYIVLLYGALKRVKKQPFVKANIAYSSFWMFFGHGWGEGWIFAPGGMVCFMFWLTLSQCYDFDLK
ncbi:MAG: O-antigen ligase family protein [Bacteroidaceae bacterium]|nr:O-antigen ligase family protein [Bacteroidaceae bacterium]